MTRRPPIIKVAAALIADPDARHTSYELSQAARVAPNRVYLALRWLLAADLVSAHSETRDESGGRPPRRYYLLTDSGRAELAELLAADDPIAAFAHAMTRDRTAPAETTAVAG